MDEVTEVSEVLLKASSLQSEDRKLDIRSPLFNECRRSWGCNHLIKMVSEILKLTNSLSGY